MINVGDILSTVGDVQYHGEYHEYHGGVILSIVGDTQYHWGYHDTYGGYREYHGGVQYHGVLK